MKIFGIGTDIVECSRIAAMLERHGEYFLERVYTPREIAYCQKHRASVERFAGRWAAKEAILKALGTGWRRGISWLDVEVCNQASGQPRVVLEGAALEYAARRGLREVQISISHCRAYASAFAIALAAENAAPASVTPNDEPPAR